MVLPNSNDPQRTGLLGLLIGRWWLVLLATAVGAGAGLYLAESADRDGPVYESRALVVATRWEQRIEGLARLVETVLQTNDFREQIRQADNEAFPRATTFGDEITVVPVEDTVAVWLEATASDPEVSERRANVAAETLVSELNRLGEDIGTFSVQDRARAPERPVGSDLPREALMAIGALGGLAIGSGLAVALPDRRRRRVSNTGEDFDADGLSERLAEVTAPTTGERSGSLRTGRNVVRPTLVSSRPAAPAEVVALEVPRPAETTNDTVGNEAEDDVGPSHYPRPLPREQRPGPNWSA